MTYREELSGLKEEWIEDNQFVIPVGAITKHMDTNGDIVDVECVEGVDYVNPCKKCYFYDHAMCRKINCYGVIFKKIDKD